MTNEKIKEILISLEKAHKRENPAGKKQSNS